MIPPDKDADFSARILNMLKALLEDQEYNDEASYFTGKIVLQLDNHIWVDDIKLLEDLSATNQTITRFVLKRTLENKSMACYNEKPLQLLYKLCESVGFELPDYSYVKEKVEMKKPSADIVNQKPQWAFLDADEYNMVYLSSVVSPSHFYLRLMKFDDL